MIDLEMTEMEMEEVIERYSNALTSIRTSGANPNLVAHTEVDYYGMATPINQISSISVIEGKQLLIKPYEMRIVKDIEKAIFAANIGLTPQNEGTQIRIVVPPLTEQRRKVYALKVKEMAEEAKIAVRNVRRDYNDQIKKDKTIPEDTQKDMLDEVQELTDKYIKKVEDVCAKKSRDLMKL